MTEYVQSTGNSDQQPRFAKYFIDPAKAEGTARSLPILLASRYRHSGQQGIEDEVAIASDPQDIIDLIREHCSQAPDFLLPDTPLKETIFRVLLAHGNEPMDAEQISAFIGQKWAMTQFPRNTSPEVIQLLLDSSDFYCIGPVPD